jgi:hypothetical protein
MSAPSSGRRVTTVEVVPPVGSRRRVLAELGLAVGAYLALFVLAALPSAFGTSLAALVVAGCELTFLADRTLLAWAHRQVGLTPLARGALRGAALVVFAARETSPGIMIATAGVLAGVAGARAVHAGAARVVTHLRTPPITARGFDLDVPPMPAAPPGWIVRLDKPTAAIDLVFTVTVACAGHWHRPGYAVAGLVFTGVASLTGPAVLAAHVLRLRRLAPRKRVSEAVSRRLLELRPEVVAYFGNRPEWRYQIEMWLRVLETVDRPVVVLLRDHEVLRTLAPTSLPVVCIPGGSTLMQLELPTPRVALYVGNSGNNIHLLRRPGVHNVFIGHGDSDKGASSNPFSRVYDEIWVAGPAGRARYADAGIDLPASTFVEVGRPQLGELPRLPDAVPRLTVLYAPTWEGWGEDPFQSSLPHVGPEIVRALLARGDVRVMYRPHPRVGHRDAATRRAHLEVVRLLHAAGARTGEEVPLPPPPTAVPDRPGDLLDLVLARPEPWSTPRHEAAVAAWNAEYWAAHPGHRVLTPPAPDLHACFGVADALIADISSVTSDFLAANRPYAVVNCSGVAESEFRRRSPSAGGGFVLGTDLAALDPLLRAAGDGADPTAAARAHARRYLLGPRTGDPAARFHAEIDRLCGTAPAAGDAVLDEATLAGFADPAVS